MEVMTIKAHIYEDDMDKIEEKLKHVPKPQTKEEVMETFLEKLIEVRREERNGTKKRNKGFKELVKAGSK